MRLGPSGKLTAEVLIDAFELWYWRRHLRVPWNAKRSNHSILKEISPEYSLEGLMLKLKLQYFGHLMQRTDSWEKTLMLGETEGRRRRQTEDEMVGWHRWTWVWASSGSWWWTGKPGMLQSTGHKDLDMTERLNWTEDDSTWLLFKPNHSEQINQLWSGMEEEEERHPVHLWRGQIWQCRQFFSL